MDVTEEDWVETCEWMVEEQQDEWPDLDIPVEKEAFDLEVFKQEFGDILKADFEKFVDEKVNAVKSELSETKDTLNTSLNDQFALYTKKEDLEKELKMATESFMKLEFSV